MHIPHLAHHHHVLFSFGIIHFFCLRHGINDVAGSYLQSLHFCSHWFSLMHTSLLRSFFMNQWIGNSLNCIQSFLFRKQNKIVWKNRNDIFPCCQIRNEIAKIVVDCSSICSKSFSVSRPSYIGYIANNKNNKADLQIHLQYCIHPKEFCKNFLC